LSDHFPEDDCEGSRRGEASIPSQFYAASTGASADAKSIFNRLQRNGGALNACECGSRHWLPPEAIYQLVPTGTARSVPAKSVIPVTCAACGFTKLYDSAIIASIAESTGRW